MTTTAAPDRASRPSNPASPASRKPMLLFAIVAFLLAAGHLASAAPRPVPQQVFPSVLPITPVTNQTPPPPSGNGNNGNSNNNSNNNNDRPTTPTGPSRPSTASATSTAAGQQQPTPTPSPSDSSDCKSGRCKVASRQNKECISLERTTTCRQFSGLYVPIDLREYFDKAFPKKKPDAIPAPLESSQHFDTVYATQNYSYPTRYIQTFMIDKVGCSVPNQLFYKTQFCMDVFQYYRDIAKHPCSAMGPAPKVCQSTLDQRADSILRDLSNGTACPVGQSARDQGAKFATDLKKHSYASGESGCIAGLTNEMDGTRGLCGYTDELTACDNGCNGIDANVCAKMRADLAALGSNVPQPPLCDENDRVPCGKGLPIGYIVLIVLGIGVVIGLATLFWTRRRVDRAELMKEEPMTLARPSATTTTTAAAAATTATASASQPLLAAEPQQPAATQQPSLTPPQPAALTAGGIAAATGSAPLVASSPPSPSPSTAAIAPIPPQCTGVDATEATVAKVRGGFPGTQDGELPLLAGDLVTVHNRFADGWALGTRHPTHGRPPVTGYFPAAYLVEANVAQVPRRADSLRRPIR